MTPHSVNDFAQNVFPVYFNKLACFGQFCKHALFGSPFCCRGSPFGPHFTQETVRNIRISSNSASKASALQWHQQCISSSASSAAVQQQQQCSSSSNSSTTAAVHQQQCISSNSAAAATVHQQQQCSSKSAAAVKNCEKE